MYADATAMNEELALGATDDASARRSTDALAPLRANATAALLLDEPDFSLSREAVRFAKGLGLAAVYGVALGARQGGRAFLVHAAFVPSALVAVAALGVPALYIALGLFDAPIDHARLVAASARAAARTGLVLAGLAPAAALFVVTSSDRHSAAAAAAVGLLAAGSIGLRSLRGEVGAALATAPPKTRAVSAMLSIGFGLFAVALATRIWTTALPLLGGGR